MQVTAKFSRNKYSVRKLTLAIAYGFVIFACLSGFPLDLENLENLKMGVHLENLETWNKNLINIRKMTETSGYSPLNPLYRKKGRLTLANKLRKSCFIMGNFGKIKIFSRKSVFLQFTPRHSAKQFIFIFSSVGQLHQILTMRLPAMLSTSES